MVKDIILKNDPELEKAINLEIKRQNDNMELIASENFVSDEILQVMGSILTNKYAEGYPGRRYYSGCEYVDMVENIAIERVKKLFSCKFANVQPHSGSQANAAAYAALINPGERVLGMALSAGGHLTHGYKVNFSGTFYKAFDYGVNDQGYIDYDEVERIAMEVKPHLIVCGASAYARTIDFARFREIANKVGAKLLADIAHIAGLVATGLHPSPLDHADLVTSTTHKTLRGARGGLILTNSEKYAKLMNKWIFPGTQGGPLMHQIAGKAVAFREALQPDFKVYCQQILNNTQAFIDEFKKLRVQIVADGSDNHLFLIDVKASLGITGKLAADLMDKINITANKNTVPNETESPFVTSGIRIGTPAMTTRGFREDDFRQAARIIHRLLTNINDDALHAKLKAEVTTLVHKCSARVAKPA